MAEMVWKSRKKSYKKCDVKGACVSNVLGRGELSGAFRGVWVMYQGPVQVLVFSKKVFLYGKKTKEMEKAVCRVWCLLELILATTVNLFEYT